MDSYKEEWSPLGADASEELKTSFEGAWAKIAASGSPFADPELAPWARETLARHILEMAKVDALDLDRLRDGALAYKDKFASLPTESLALMLSVSSPR
jgi:hypothetical protein